ncbi:MAG: right-handed parallel beta-helix repeat-containing protein [candidate division Zixibacteria bacterium]|nr:right-handed parallel beta-helix repeat-containing protein [candidate division Zixibacteria bacterium]
MFKRQSLALLPVILLAVALVSVAGDEGPVSRRDMMYDAARASEYWPDGTSDQAKSTTRSPAMVFFVTNTADSGPGSLRDAINMANATPGHDSIWFQIPSGTPVVTIMPLSALPWLTDPAGVTIDGLTQPGASIGAQPPRTLVLTVEIDGFMAGATRGLVLNSSSNLIQGLIVNNFSQSGICIQGGPVNDAMDNQVQWNIVGLDPTGTLKKPNGQGTAAVPAWAGVCVCNAPAGIPAFAQHNMIEENLISANHTEGVTILGPIQPGDVFGNFVTGNYIGTDITGMVDLGNDGEGVCLCEGTHHNTVAYNLISGNDLDGVGIQGYGIDEIYTTFNLIEANIIGMNRDRTLPLPNSYHGVAIGEYGDGDWGFATDNTVAVENLIAYNGRDGIAVWEEATMGNTINADRNMISQNFIFDNVELGIDLGNNGVTNNDLTDPDVGANQEVNFPVITSAVLVAGTTTITGTLDIDTDPTQAAIEVFIAAVDPSGHGEGRTYIGTVSADAAGNWSLVTLAPAAGDAITANTTDMNRNTSEFCANVIVSPEEPPWDCFENPPPNKTGGGQEAEPNNSCAMAFQAQCEFAYCGDLSIADPEDWWSVTLPADTCHCLHVRVFADDTPDQYAYSGGLDATVTIYDDDCTTQLFFNDDHNGVFPDAVGTDAQYDCLDAGNCYDPGKTLYIKVGSSPAGGGPEGPYLLVINCEVCECPAPTQDLVVCEPQGPTNPTHPPNYWYDVTPGPGSGGRCDFHVKVFDSIQANYSNWIEPVGWQHVLHKVGSDWWVSWWSPGCTNAFFATTRFGFDNVNPSVWGDWVTTTSGTNDPTASVVDYSGTHTADPNGYGYRVHVPRFQEEPEEWDHKMHFPQLPDEAGWDVMSTFPVGCADDWQCSETGWVKDIHFWGSWMHGVEAPIDMFYLTIWSDIPEDPPLFYSRPGDLLWVQQLPIDMFTVTPIQPLTPEGWYNPWTAEVFMDDHFQYVRYDLILPEELWFWQDEGRIYWLGVQAVVPDEMAHWGWKSSVNHFNDDAVWAVGSELPRDWFELYEPPFFEQSLDLSFVITGSCCIDTVGNVQLIPNCDYADQIVDISDLTNLIDHLFISFTPICCVEEADIAPLISGLPPDNSVDVGDLTALIDHLFISFPALPPCP